MTEVQESNAFAYQLLDVEKACRAHTRQQHQNLQYKNTRWRNNNYHSYYDHQPHQQHHQQMPHMPQMPQVQTQMPQVQSQMPQVQTQMQPQTLQMAPQMAQMAQMAPMSQSMSQPMSQSMSQPTALSQAPHMNLSDSFLTRQRSYQYEQPDTPKSVASLPADSKINDLKLFDPFDTLTPTSTSGSFLSALDSPALLPQKSQPTLFRSQTAFAFSESSRLWGTSSTDDTESKSSVSNWNNVW